MDRLDEIHKDVKEVREQLIELIKQGAIHNSVLTEHERRSTNLEARLLPIESWYQFFSKISVAMIGIGGVAGALLTLSHFIKDIK